MILYSGAQLNGAKRARERERERETERIPVPGAVVRTFVCWIRVKGMYPVYSSTARSRVPISIGARQFLHSFSTKQIHGFCGAADTLFFVHRSTVFIAYSQHKTSTIRKRAVLVHEGVMAETNGEENLPEVLSVIMCVVSVGLPVSSY